MSKKTRQVQVGSVRIGGGAPVAVQSMCNTHTSDARATIEQIARLHGREVLRIVHMPVRQIRHAPAEVGHRVIR